MTIPPRGPGQGGSGSDGPGGSGGGAGDGAVRRPRVAFPGISSRAYEHPADRTALTALRKVPYAPTILRRLAGLFSERRLRLLFLGSAVRVSEEQFPSLHTMRNEVAKTLDLTEVPELYIAQGPYANAMTLGVDHPFIVVNSAAVDLFDEDELRFVIGHEMGHVLSGHALYTSVLYTLMRLSGVATSIPLGSVGLIAVVNALKEWFRKAELSCDRAGLLAVQDVGAATRAHMKMAAGSHLDDMDVRSFVAQGEEYQSTGDVRDGVARLLNLLGTTHPFAAVRAVELGRWVGSGEYDRIVAGEYPRRGEDPDTSLADEIRAAASSYKESWDTSEDALVKTLREAGAGAANLVGQGIGKVVDYVRTQSGRGGPGGSGGSGGPGGSGN